jgi:ribosomal-protein-alanine N-acetyltransferase
VLELARNAFGLTRVLATCRPENLASVRVLEKIGMLQVDYLRGHKHIDGEARDSVVFASCFSAGDAASTTDPTGGLRGS